MAAVLKKVGAWFAPPAKKADDGRDQWPSRLSFILASMGGAIGMGNVLRFPSQVFNNNGLQWFVPYLMAIFLLAIPALILEISVGQAYRGGCVVSYNNISNRLKGTGLGLNFIGFVIVTYFVPILAWVMVYFRQSFISPLPWTENAKDHYLNVVVANVDPIEGTFSDTGAVESYSSYPGTALIAETTAWCLFTWFVVWLCMFRGVGLTGRVVYFTMGIPLVTIIILIGRGVSLPEAGRGVKWYFGTWNGGQLSQGKIWQEACSQVFFSTGVGFGYYTAYASYNAKFSNAVQDSIIIVASNCSFETIAAFGVFGIIGNLNRNPADEEEDIGSFDIGFQTYPDAVTKMPGANFWAILFFFTLMLLGISSSFAMLDAVATLIMDTQWGVTKASRPIVVTVLVTVAFLLSLPYCTQFGMALLSGVDRFINDIGLVFIVWAECVLSTTVYRYKDVVSQVGLPSFIAYNAGFFGAMILGVGVAHAVTAEAGAGLAFGLYILGLVVSILIGKTPDSKAPRFWGKNTFVSRFWYLAFYSGNQLRRDLNVIVGAGKNWNIPPVWAPLLRYVAAPILAIIFGFAYPKFFAVRNDPTFIFGFAVSHLVLLSVIFGFLAPRWFNVFVPVHRRAEGDKPYSTNMLMGTLDAESDNAVESGLSDVSSNEKPAKSGF